MSNIRYTEYKKKQTSEAAVREIRRRTRRKFPPEEKIRIVLEGLRGEASIADLCRRDHAQEPSAQKKSDGSWRGGRFVRRTDSEKMEIIRLVEGTELPVRATLRQLDVPLHRREAVLRIRIERLPDLEGRRSDHQPGLDPDVGLRCIQRSNDSRPRDVANGLHLPSRTVHRCATRVQDGPSGVTNRHSPAIVCAIGSHETTSHREVKVIHNG
jgi:transposase-like protein